MEIGGRDSSISKTWTQHDLLRVMRVVHKRWPRAWLVRDGFESHYVLDLINTEYLSTERFFFYKDPDWRQSWDRDGRTEANRDTMFQIQIDQNGIHFVVDEAEDSETGRLVEAIKALFW